MNRQEFIKQIGGTSLFFMCGGTAAVLNSCSKSFYINGNIQNGNAILNKSDFMERAFIVFNNPELEHPVYVYKKNENDYVALSMKCTHKGCQLKPTGKILVCPCHGSEFSNAGKVLAPPAEADLKQFSVNLTNDHILITLK